jgi:uncharacterized protein YndB with AHSA1/START domain
VFGLSPCTSIRQQALPVGTPYFDVTLLSAGVRLPVLDTDDLANKDDLMKITVKTTVIAPIDKVWGSYTTPEDIKQWNTASDDWHTTKSTVDLRVGGAFTSRMEAKDGSFGFDFAGTYTAVVPNKRLEYSFGDRIATVEFETTGEGPEKSVLVRVTFEAEETHSVEQQRGGWQAILNNFARHVEQK